MSSPITSRVRLVVPPVADKVGYYEHEEMRLQWQLADIAVRNAKRICCLGYSLPQSDLAMRFLLAGKSQRNDRTSFQVVSRNLPVLASDKDMKSRYDIDLNYVRPENPIQEFVAALDWENTDNSDVGEKNVVLRDYGMKSLRVSQTLHASETGPPIGKITAVNEKGVRSDLEPHSVPVMLSWERISEARNVLRQSHALRIRSAGPDHAASLEEQVGNWFPFRFVDVLVGVLKELDLVTISGGNSISLSYQHGIPYEATTS